MAKKENTSAAAKVAKAEKEAKKGADDSKLTSAQKIAKAEKTKAKAAKAKNPNGNAFQRFGKGFKKFWKDFRGEIKKITWPWGIMQPKKRSLQQKNLNISLPLNSCLFMRPSHLFNLVSSGEKRLLGF